MPRWSQVFLFDRTAINRIASAIPISGKTVLEIGAGEGVLTAALAKNAGARGKVVALEIDRSLSGKMEKRLHGVKNVEVNFVDAVKFDFGGFKIIFGNLPYHLSSKILFKIIDSNFSRAVVCLQKEFAERLVAKPGGREYSRLSVAAQNACDVKILFEIPRFCFVPIPRVDSAVVLLEAKPSKGRLRLNQALVAALFQHKNQSIRKALLHSRKALGVDKKILLSLCESMPLREKRARHLSLDDFAALSEWFESSILANR